MVRVYVNLACTLDGAMGVPGPGRLRISGPEDVARVHALRAESDAILVGIGTVLADDPKLTVKWDLVGRKGRDPVRVVLDRDARTPESARILNRAAPTLVYHDAAEAGDARFVRAPRAPGAGVDLAWVLSDLARRGVKRLMVEGGPTVIAAFLAQGLVDELTMYVAPRTLDEALAPRIDWPVSVRGSALRFKSARPLGDGAVVHLAR